MNRSLTVIAIGWVLVVSASAKSATLATATYDTDSYMFVGTNNETERDLSLTEDLTITQGPFIVPNNAHFLFGLIKFDNLAGLSTKAAGGGNKYLKLTTANVPGAGTIGISVAKSDVFARNGTGYPAGTFGNAHTSATDRLTWFLNNIKGSNPDNGGLLGGATQLGVMQIASAGTYYLNVTTAVDAWITGTTSNYGFGLWSITDEGEQGNTLDFVSMDSPVVGNRPGLVNTYPGEPTERTPGDANEDGVVNRLDLAIIVSAFGQTSGATWATGDFNNDGHVSLADVNILHANLTPSGSPNMTAVPEPTSAALALLGVTATMIYRRRSRPVC